MVSTTAEFRHTFGEAGSYTVTYRGVNAKGEERSASWTVEVAEADTGYVFENFETLTSLASDYIKEGNKGSLSIVGNPYPTTANSSSKVLKVDMAPSA